MTPDQQSRPTGYCRASFGGSRIPQLPDFKMACSYAASQGWLIVEEDGLTLTTAGLAAA